MIATVSPSGIEGTLYAPASKSSMQRACAAALLTNGITTIANYGKSNDDKAALDIIQRLGAKLQIVDETTLTIESNGFAKQHGTKGASIEIACGESGLSIRMFTSIAALSAASIHITGTGSLVTRPMDFFDVLLPQIGVHVASNQGKLPITIQGPLQPANITIDGSLSSQFLTGLLMAFAAANESATIYVQDLKSKPYIDLTLDVMQQFGMNVPVNHAYQSFQFTPTDLIATPKQIYYTVESDWSGGAFLLVAAAIASQSTMVVKGLGVFSTQADKAILQALMDAGVSMSITEQAITIQPSVGLKPFHFNATDCPDLFPPLVALAAYCQGISAIEGVSRLAHKESNRALTLQEEFGKLGINIDLQDDLMLVKGGTGVQAGAVHSHHDHRIAMACAVAALRAAGDVIIACAESVNKSYPNFYEHLQQLNATVVLQ